MTYKEFLEITGQVSEEEFDKVTKSLPEVSSEEFKNAFDSYWWEDFSSPESLAKEISDNVIFLDEGKILKEGSSDDIFVNSNNDRINKFLQNFNK